VGDYTILRTDTGGASWSEIEHPMGNAWLYDVSFADGLIGQAVGDFATILRTEDGGLSWTLENSSGNDADFLLAVAQTDSSNAIAVGWFGGGEQNALRSSDGGQSWTVEPTGYDRSLRAVAYQEDLLIVTGLAGLLLKAEENPTAAPMPTRPFVLLQNRPNPFNPSTTIYYGLLEDGDVTLNIYDLAGRRVKTLISGLVVAGDHEVQWHGRDHAGRRVATGVYFYRLQADSFLETKRMVLIK
jgi:hypothetical protein